MSKQTDENFERYKHFRTDKNVKRYRHLKTDKNLEQDKQLEIEENFQQNKQPKTVENLVQNNHPEVSEKLEQNTQTDNDVQFHDFALPVQKHKKSKKNSIKKTHQASAYDDLDDFIYKTPAKGRPSKHHHRHHRKKMKRWKKVIIIILIVLLLIILSAISALIIATNIGRGEMLDGNNDVVINVPKDIVTYRDGKVITYKGKDYKLNENITSILFMGVDEREFEENDSNYGTNGNADVLMLMTIDTETGESNLISIPRDTMADINIYSIDGNYVGTEKRQIALAYSYGNGKETSCENEVTAVRRMFYNIPINSYLALDLDSISAVNDSIGGVTVTSPETIGQFTEGETVTLLGKMAESFVRIRSHEELDANLKRMERQKMYLSGFFDKFIESTKGNIMTPVDLYNSANPYMVSNIDISKVTYLSSLLLQKNFTDFNLQTIDGELKQGEVYAEYYADEEKLFDLFINVFYTQISD